MMRRSALLVLALGACGDGGTAPLPPVTDPIPYADPFIGSGGFGFGFGSSFAGAAAPHGLVKVGPDTSGEFGTVNFLHYSGYWYEDHTIQGFSHLHLHGTGATDYGVISLMPTPAFDPARTSVVDYQSLFSKDSERASPGLYQVTLDEGDIAVELTATPHAAHHRYGFGAGGGAVVLDLAKTLSGGEITEAEVTIVDDRTLRGRIHHVGGMSGGFGGYDVFFELRARDAWTGIDQWDTGAALTFAAESVELQVGVSLVDAAGATANLDAEMPSFDFDGTHAATEDAWRALLSRVLVEGGTEAERRMLYSALYRAFLMPTIMSDVDGRYVYGGTIQTADGFRFVSDLSLWDTYRTLHPLYHLVYPESGRDAVRSLVAMAEVGGFFPRWPIATGEAGTMVGASAEIVIADAYVKGIRDFDAQFAYDLMRAAAMDETPPPGGRGGRGEVELYIAQGGWLPSSVSRSVGKTTEFAHDDFALAELAEALGDDATAEALRQRRLGYRELYDPATGFLRGRAADGSFSAEPFDPLDLGDEYVEANAWHSLFAAPHDATGMVELLGGEEAFIARLTTFFEEAEADWAAAGADDLTAQVAPRPYYWHGNETDLHAAYLFAQVGRPELTQRWVRWIMNNLYSDRPSGVPGNDDGGTMAAWYVFSALGFYPVAGSTEYVVGIPTFSRATVETAGGTLVVEAVGSGDRVVEVTLDGAPLATPSLDHAQLAGGDAELVFTLSDN